MSSTASYWCYRCAQFVRVLTEGNVSCPYCDGGFVEALDGDAPPSSDSSRRFPSAAMYMFGNNRSGSDREPNLRIRRPRRNQGDRSPFNPVVVLRGPADGGGDGDGVTERSSFELYYNDGAGSGLRPLPAAMSEFLMGSGFDRLLDQLGQIEINAFGRQEHPPASKAAVESMPTIEIVAGHVCSDTQCAVCHEAFDLGSEAREMPCKHIYHSDCILPWLSLRNSCPVCRYELPTDSSIASDLVNAEPANEEAVGMTIWRLPGGGFAVGRFSGGGRPGESELPAVYTEMDGGFNNTGTNGGGGGGGSGGGPRRIAWGSRGSRSRNGSGIGNAFRNMFSFIGRLRPSSSSSSRSGSESASIRRSQSHQSRSVFSRYVRRRSRAWVLEDQNGMARW